MTVREFIDRVTAQARKGWEHLEPCWGEWGDGVKTGCAVTALASEPMPDSFLESQYPEREFVHWAEATVATVAIDAGMTVDEAYRFSEGIVGNLADVYDNVVHAPKHYAAHIQKVIMDADILVYWHDANAISEVIGCELRRVAECVMNAKKNSAKSEKEPAANCAAGLLSVTQPTSFLVGVDALTCR